jgi:hypothetical protein
MHVCASERHVVSQICISLIELVASFAHPSNLLHYEEPTSVCAAITPMGQALDLLPGEGFGEGTPAPHKVTRLDRVPPHQLGCV